jgi:uncharacterized protein (TIGR03435 family)
LTGQVSAPTEPGKLPTVYYVRIVVGRRGPKGASVPLDDLIDGLSRGLAYSVLDETGLTGKYDVNLQWSAGAAFPLPDASQPSPSHDSGSTIWSAIY